MENNPFSTYAQDNSYYGDDNSGLSLSAQAQLATHGQNGGGNEAFQRNFAKLNARQKQAVETTEGALLVLAGAGTGKTSVLTTRIAHIINNLRVNSYNILAVTFTNKAAKEMEYRIRQMVSDAASGLWIGTFHSICLRMLRRYGQLVGLKDNFSIIDSDDQLRLIKQMLKERKVDEKKYPPKSFTAYINSKKDKAIEALHNADGNLGFADSIYADIYLHYERQCDIMNVVDFGGIILKSIRLLKENSDVLNSYQRQFKYMLVDEYQDTNTAQYLWLRLLAQAQHNICCVGDDDQSIYGWRGADVGNILRFEKDFRDAQIIRLETNYRSTSQILAAADAVISNNKERLGKVLHSNFGEGTAIKLASVWDDRAEAEFIADEIEAMQQNKKVELSDIAILVRAGYQTRAFEECFLRKAIPYRIVGGLKFYDRLEVKDAIAYFRAVCQSDNDLALERIINVPKRGLGSKTIDELRYSAREQNISLYAAIKNAIKIGSLKPRVKNTLQDLMIKFDYWRELIKTKGHVDVAENILEDSGYIQMWKDENTIESKGRLENLQELINALATFRDMDDFLEHVSLVSDNDDKPVDDMLSIMTIHGAKGLEFDNVFLPGWEEGVFPSQQTIDEKAKEGIEEERRLAYVAITRAKHNLLISFAASRMVFGNIVSSAPSRFIDELPANVVDIVQGSSLSPSYRDRQNSSSTLKQSLYEKRPASFVSPAQYNKSLKEKLANKRAENSTASNTTSPAGFRVGDKIRHTKFGVGRVLNVNGKHLQIVFEEGSIKTLVEDYVQKGNI